MGRRLDVDLLVGSAEIAQRLSLGHQNVVHVWQERHPDFPQPVVRLRAAKVWYWPDVEGWARATGRLPEE